jgi:hypothetical protein
LRLVRSSEASLRLPFRVLPTEHPTPGLWSLEPPLLSPICAHLCGGVGVRSPDPFPRPSDIGLRRVPTSGLSPACQRTGLTFCVATSVPPGPPAGCRGAAPPCLSIRGSCAAHALPGSLYDPRQPTGRAGGPGLQGPFCPVPLAILFTDLWSPRERRRHGSQPDRPGPVRRCGIAPRQLRPA